MTNHSLPVEVEEAASDAELLTPRLFCQRVLIVEDERRLRDMLHASLREMGLSPTCAPSAEAAMRLLQTERFAIAIVDLNLPLMDGLELCQTLHDRKLNLQFIILTGFGDLEAAQRAIRLDVVDFLTKPCAMDQLETALSRARLRWLERWLADREQPASTTPAPSPPATVPHAPPDLRSRISMDDAERELILAALSRHAQNREAAAAELGISVRKIYYRLQQYQKQGWLDAKVKE